jgi:hypothetical protein
MTFRKLVIVGICVSCLFLIAVPNVRDTALAESGDKYIVSVISNGGWALNKVSRKLMFFRYTDPQETWTTNPIVLPQDIDLNNCVLQAVGSRGTPVFLYDKSSHVIRLYQAKKDHSTLDYGGLNLGTKLQ